MGLVYTVRCPECEYWAELFVGTGMRSTLATFICTRCRALVSAPTATRDEGTFELLEVPPACPDCGATNVVRWPPDCPADTSESDDEDDPPLGPCPECGTRLVDEGVRGIWD